MGGEIDGHMAVLYSPEGHGPFFVLCCQIECSIVACYFWIDLLDRDWIFL